MLVKGLINKIYRLNSNTATCSKGDLDKLKEGKSVELKKEDAEQLIKMGMAETVKPSNKEKK